MKTLTFIRDNWETISWIVTATALLAANVYTKVQAKIQESQNKQALNVVTKAIEVEGAKAVKVRVRDASVPDEVRQKIEESVANAAPLKAPTPAQIAVIESPGIAPDVSEMRK